MAKLPTMMTVILVTMGSYFQGCGADTLNSTESHEDTTNYNNTSLSQNTTGLPEYNNSTNSTNSYENVTPNGNSTVLGLLNATTMIPSSGTSVSPANTTFCRQDSEELEDAIIQCSRPFVKSNYIGFDQVFPVYNKNVTAITLCQEYYRLRECLFDNVRTRCPGIILISADRIERAAGFVCENQFSTYIEKKECILKVPIDYCIEKYELTGSINAAYELVQEPGLLKRKSQVCGLLKGFLQCQKLQVGALNYTCRDMGSFLDRVQEQWLEPLADTIGCQLIDINYGKIAGIAVGCILGAVLFMIICCQFCSSHPSDDM